MDKNLERMRKCPQFNKCSAPKCPLDEDMNIRIYFKGDPKCTLSKKLRTALGLELPWKGLLPMELGGKKSWLKRSFLSRELTVKNLVSQGKKFRFASREKS